MSTQTAPAPVVVRVREDLVTLALPGHDATREALRDARKLAAKEAHTLVGGAQNPRNATHDGRRVTLVDYAPVQRRQASAPAPAQTVPAPDALASMSKRELRDLVAQLLAARATAPAPASKPAREIPPVIAARIAKSHAITCKTCRDLGVVRGVGADAGKPYRTQNGADAAKVAGRAVPCPDHKRARKTA